MLKAKVGRVAKGDFRSQAVGANKCKTPQIAGFISRSDVWEAVKDETERFF